MEQNTLVVNTGDRLVLFDTGDGGSKMFGPKSGRLLANLKAAGIDPKDIDVVALTHAHPDHCWGLMAADGTPNFPNAQIAISQADFDFWTDEGKAQGDMMKPMIEGTRRQLMPNRGRMIFIKDGQEIAPGIRAMAAPGHTVGHTIFIIASGGKTLVNTGDIAHHHIDLDADPARAFVYRHRRRAGRGEPAQGVRHAGGGPHPVRVVSFPLAGARLCGEAGGRLSLFRGADADGAVADRSDVDAVGPG